MAWSTTGFGFGNPTTPGFWLENTKYKVQFRGMRCDNANFDERSQWFCVYNWAEVMNVVLGATERVVDYTIDIEEAAEDALRKWMTSFQGWGLWSSIASLVSIEYFVLSHRLVNLNWDVEKHGDYQEEEVFNIVRQMYEHGVGFEEGMEIEKSVPKIAIWFEEIVTGGEESERKKNLTICISGEWDLEVKFVVEKKRVNRNLVELAAETLVRSIYSEDEVKNLEIPRELLETVMCKFRDAEWVRDYWRLKADLEEIAHDRIGCVIEEEMTSDLVSKDVRNQDRGANLIE